jgi:hypothetical protein
VFGFCVNDTHCVTYSNVPIYIYIKKFCKCEIYYCHDTMSDYHSNRLSIVNILHEFKLYSRSRMSKQSFISV